MILEASRLTLTLVIVIGCSAFMTTLAANAEPVPRGQLEAWLADGNRAYDEGVQLRDTNPTAARRSFERAIASFQSIADTGIKNGKLYYNLGNAYLQMGAIGQAIASYRRAESLIPDDPNLEANLSYARSLCRSPFSSTGSRAVAQTLFFWHYDIPLRIRFVVGMAAYICFWALLACRFIWPKFRWGYAIIPTLLIWMTLAASVGYSLIERRYHTEGVIVGEDVVVRKGNGEMYQPQFEETLQPGVELSIEEHRGDWIRVRFSDNREGWVREGTVEVI